MANAVSAPKSAPPPPQPIINAELLSRCQAIEGYLSSYRSQLAECQAAKSEIMEALLQSQAIGDLREMLTPLMPMVMRLMGSPLGFMTDKDRDPPGERYKPDVVAGVVCEALMRGFQLVGNHFNIIAARFYGTKNGFENALSKLPGLTDLVVIPGVPAMMGEKGALVPVYLSWKWFGKPGELRYEQVAGQTDRRIPIRQNAGMGADAIIGKAISKAYRRLYVQLTMTAISGVDDEPGDDAPATDAGVLDGEVVSSDPATPVAATTAEPTAAATSVPVNGDDGMSLDEYVAMFRKELSEAPTEAAAQLVRDRYCGANSEYELPPEMVTVMDAEFRNRCNVLRDQRSARSAKTELPRKTAK